MVERILPKFIVARNNGTETIIPIKSTIDRWLDAAEIIGKDASGLRLEITEEYRIRRDDSHYTTLSDQDVFRTILLAGEKKRFDSYYSLKALEKRQNVNL